MMKWTVSGALCAAVLIASASSAHADAVLSSTKNGAYATLSGLTVTPSYTGLFNVAIAKAKKKRVLEVDVALTETTNTATSLRTFVRVNGFDIEPAPANDQVAENCGLTHPNCTVEAVFWADLDALEASFPGSFIGQPLSVEVWGQAGPAAGLATGTVRARMVKK